MNFQKILGPASFKKGNYFFDLHEENFFNREAYISLIETIRLYKQEIGDNEFIDKSIIGMLFLGVNIFSGVEEMCRNSTIQVKGLKKGDDLNDYYNELIAEIGLLLK